MKKYILTFLISIISLTLIGQSDSIKKDIKYQALIGYNTDIYTKPNQRIFNVYNVGLGFKTPKTALYGIVNSGHLISDSLYKNDLEFQYELDFYQTLTKTTDLWLNYAYSNDIHFPNHRALGRVWQEIPNVFIVSGGVMYYRFDSLNYWSALASIEKYMGKFWVEGKTIFYFKEPKMKMGYELSGRYFWKDVNFLQLTLGTGAAQDEPWRMTVPSDFTAHYAQLILNQSLSKKISMRLGMSYFYEEYDNDLWRNRYMPSIMFKFNFN